MSPVPPRINADRGRGEDGDRNDYDPCQPRVRNSRKRRTGHCGHPTATPSLQFPRRDQSLQRVAAHEGSLI